MGMRRKEPFGYDDGVRPSIRNLKSSLIIAAMLVLTHGVYLLFHGPLQGSDTAKYVAWADRMAGLHFNAWAYTHDLHYVIPPVAYLGFVTLFALIRTIAGTHWEWAVAIVNLVADCTSGLITVIIVRRATRSAVATWATLVFYAASIDVMMWTPYALSESTFLLVVMLSFAPIVRSFQVEKANARAQWLLAAAALLVCAFYRPTGIVQVIAAAGAFVMWRFHRKGVRVPRLILASAAVGLLLVVSLHAWLVQEPARWPFKVFASGVAYDSGIYGRGEVINGRPETDHAPPQTLWQYESITIDRFVHFFAFTASTFSPKHKIAQTLYYLPLLIFAVTGSAGLFRPSSRMPGEDAPFMLASLFVLAYAYFHAVIQVDYDWRYRLPAMPFMIMLAAKGVDNVIGSITLRRQQANSAGQ